MPDAFTDLACVTRSHIPAANTPAKINVLNVRRTVLLEARDANSSDPRTLAASQLSALIQKPGRPLGSKDSHPWKRKSMAQGPEEPLVNPTITYSFYPTHEEILDYGSVLEETNPPPENRKILVHYASLDDVWRRNEMIVDDALAFAVATEIMLSDDIEPCSIDECRLRTDWSNWKQAIQVELDSLAKRKVFGPVAPTPPHVKPVRYMWVFILKRNEKNKIVRYKARLVTQGFSQRLGIVYDETYSPVMDVITFRYLISLVVFEKLDMQQMDVVTAYLYRDLDTEIYMKVSEGLTLTGSNIFKPRNTLSIRLRRSLYGLKQSGRMWYNRLSAYLTSQGYVNNELCPCVFINKSHSRFVIVAVYVDDMNLIGTPEELPRTASHLKSKFEMKDLGKTRYYLGLEIGHCSDGILVH